MTIREGKLKEKSHAYKIGEAVAVRMGNGTWTIYIAPSWDGRSETILQGWEDTGIDFSTLKACRAAIKENPPASKYSNH